jgi:hypothetical protein
VRVSDLIFADRMRGDRALEQVDGPERRAAQAFEARVWQPPGPVDLTRLRSAFAELPAGVIRSKGYLTSDASGSPLVQSVGRRVKIERSDLQDRAGLVFIALTDSVEWETWLERLDRTCSMSTG